MVLTNGQGKIERYSFTGLATQYLAGNGTWQTLPATNTAWLTANNPADVYKPTGNVGIGAQPSPFFKLDVIGDARISNNLYVGGGVIITDKVQAATLIKGLDFKVDNDLDVQNSTVLRGATQLNGATTVNGSINVNNNAYFNSPVSFNTITEFNNTATFTKSLRAVQGIAFNTANIGISYTPTATTGGGVFNYGRNIGSNILLPLPPACAATPFAPFGHQFGGWVQIFDVDATGAPKPNTGLLNMQSFTNGNSGIDASVGGNTPNELFINYFCGSNTQINTGANGGKVSMGKNVEIGFPYPQSLACALNVKGDVDYQGLNVSTNHTQDWLTAAQINVTRDRTTALIVSNTKPTGAYDYTFRVMGDGLTAIGAIPAGQFGDAMLNVYSPSNKATIQTYDASGKINFKVSANGYVYAREINVMPQNLIFPDYVFDKNYNLLTIAELDNYITANKHLPNIPSATEVQKDGLKLADMQVKQMEKIEEAYLYIIELKKQNDLLQQRLQAIESKLLNR